MAVEAALLRVRADYVHLDVAANNNRDGATLRRGRLVRRHREVLSEQWQQLNLALRV